MPTQEKNFCHCHYKLCGTEREPASKDGQWFCSKQCVKEYTEDRKIEASEIALKIANEKLDQNMCDPDNNNNNNNDVK